MTDPSQYFKGRTVQEQMNEVIGYVDVRSAEVATDAIAADVAQVHQDMLDADADATAAAASAAAAAGTLANAVKKTGEASQSIAGDIAVAGDLSGGSVTVPTPVNNTDAASKKYVDDADALKLNITDVNSYAVGLTGNQTKAGVLTLTEPLIGTMGNWHYDHSVTAKWVLFAKLTTSANGSYAKINCIQASSTATCAGSYVIGFASHVGKFLYRKSIGGNDPLTGSNEFALILYNGDWYIGVKKASQYGGLVHRVDTYVSYGTPLSSAPIDWLPADAQYVFDDDTQFTTVNNITD